MKSLRQGAIVATGLLALLLGWLFWPHSPQPAKVERLGPVTVGASNAVTAALVWISRDKGFFEEAGVEVTLKGYEFGKAAIDALVNDQVDLGTTAEFVISKMAPSHADLRVLSTIAMSHDISIVGAKEKGVATPADLEGRRVGVTMGSASAYFLSRLLSLNGLAANSVTWVDMQPPAMPEAMAKGDVDAVIVWQPHVDAVVNRMAENVYVFDGQPNQDYFFIVVGRQAWLAQHGREAERIVQALKLAENWMAANPTEAQAYLVERFGVIHKSYGDGRRGHIYNVALPKSLLIAFEEEGRWLEQQDNSKKPRLDDYRRLFEVAPLAKVAPNEVAVGQ